MADSQTAADAPARARAVAKYVHMSPSKIRRLTSLVKGKPVQEALELLKLAPHAAAEPVYKVIASAAANAENNHAMNRDALVVALATADEGPTLKRIRPRAQGRAYRIRKRTSHITVEVAEAPKGAKGSNRRAKGRAR